MLSEGGTEIGNWTSFDKSGWRRWWPQAGLEHRSLSLSLSYQVGKLWVQYVASCTMGHLSDNNKKSLECQRQQEQKQGGEAEEKSTGCTQDAVYPTHVVTLVTGRHAVNSAIKILTCLPPLPLLLSQRSEACRLPGHFINLQGIWNTSILCAVLCLAECSSQSCCMPHLLLGQKQPEGP